MKHPYLPDNSSIQLFKETLVIKKFIYFYPVAKLLGAIT